MEWIPIAGFWAVVLFAIRDPHRLIYVVFATMPFGSMAVLPPALTGGLTLTPFAMASGIFSAVVLVRPGGLSFLKGALDIRVLGLLGVFMAIAVVVTICGPRLFAEQVNVIEMRMAITRSVPLKPTAQNLSQVIYLSTSIATVFALARVAPQAASWKAIQNGLLIAGCLAIVSGVLDMSGPTVGGFLSMFRTATYALLTQSDVFGAKRVVGLMTEASSYGALCLGLAAALHFLGRLFAEPIAQTLRPIIVVGLVVCVALSTSSSAYVGLIIFVGIAGVEWVWRMLRSTSPGADTRQLRAEAVFGVVAIFIVAAVILINPHVADPAVSLFNHMVLDKASSASFSERSMWNAVSWQALLGTDGIGVGVGATRASNAAIAIASNTGFAGAICFYGFILYHMLRSARRVPQPQSLALGYARLTTIPILAMGFLVNTGTSFDLIQALCFALWGVTVPSGEMRRVTSFGPPALSADSRRFGAMRAGA